MFPDDFLKKNIALWEKLSAAYLDTIFDTTQTTLENSKAIQEQFDKAISSTINLQMETALVTLKALQHQVEALAEKVDRLLEIQLNSNESNTNNIGRE